MFEEVPRERRGLGRWLLAHSVGFGQFRFGTTVARPVVLRPLVTRPLVLRPLAVGPFVLGGGMLLAAVGGSVAVAAAATVLTASAIGSSGDVPPPHPVSVTGPSTHAAPRHAAPAPDRQPAASRPAGSAHRASGAPGSSGAPAAGVASSVSPTAPAVSTPASSAVPSPTGSPVAPVPPPSASTDPAPSSSGPLGNALVHVSGFDQATGRLAYQFAAAGAGGRYTITPQTFSAVLAPAASIVSGGTLCPPAGSSCTPDELGAASGAGFFAELAIDATGTVRSVVEVGDQASARLAPGPSGSPDPASSLPS